MYVIYVKQGPTFRCKTMVSKHKNLFVHACFYTVVYSITFQNSQTVSLAAPFCKKTNDRNQNHYFFLVIKFRPLISHAAK